MIDRTRLSRRTLAAALCVATVATVRAATASDGFAPKIERFRRWAEQQMARDDLPGLSIGFVKDGYMWTDGLGFADLENRVPAHGDSAYRLASVTKPMTAVGVLELVEQGRIDLDADVRQYVPYFPPKPWPVTVRQLLGHLGGVSHYRNYDLEGHFKDHKDTRASIAVFADFDLVAEPGTRYSYTSYGYNLLGAVIEQASGQPYAAFMREHVWGPLGMDSTRMDDPYDLIPHRVRGYRRGPDGQLMHSEFVDISSRFAAGGTRSTVGDMLRFAAGLGEGRVLEPETLEASLRSMVTTDGVATGYGYGWVVRPVNGRKASAHSGGQAETATYLLWLPDVDLAIAAATNLEGGDRMPYIKRLYEVVLEEPWFPPVYAGDRVHQAVHAALATAWSHGLAHATHSGGPLSADGSEVADAFAFFNEHVRVDALETDFDAVRGRIAEAAQPSGGQKIQIVGSFIAARLLEKADAAATKRLHRDGPIPMFHEYARLCRRGDVGGDAYRLAPDLETLIAAWSGDWARTWNERTFDIDIAAADDLPAAVARLTDVCSGASVYPDHWPAMEDRLGALLRRGRLGEAETLVEAARTLYPTFGDPCVAAAALRLARGETEQATDLLRHAAAVEPDTASARVLNNRAYDLRSAGQTALGLALLRVAVELHPEVANLHDSIGEFLLVMGEREAAVDAYRRALELDPTLPSALRVLEELGESVVLEPVGGE